MNATILSALAGACFGLWPIVMQRSNLNGYMQPVVFSGVLLLATVGLAFNNPGDLTKARWQLAIVASAIGALGTILYMSSIAKTVVTHQSLATVVLMQVIVQTMIPVVVEVIQSKTMSWHRVSGCLLAITSLILLTRK